MRRRRTISLYTRKVILQEKVRQSHEKIYPFLTVSHFKTKEPSYFLIGKKYDRDSCWRSHSTNGSRIWRYHYQAHGSLEFRLLHALSPFEPRSGWIGLADANLGLLNIYQHWWVRECESILCYPTINGGHASIYILTPPSVIVLQKTTDSSWSSTATIRIS